MTHAALVVIGGGPAGFAAARGYREAGGTGEVIVLAREPRLPYRRPPLTKEYLRGELAAEELPLESSGWLWANEIRVQTGAWATAIDPGARTIATDSAELSFDRCVLAMGSQPSRPELPGAHDAAVHTVRTLEDSDALRRLGEGERVVVVGSGFIGCEAAASLAMRRMEVELVTDENRPQEARLGYEVGDRLAGWLRQAGVSLRLGSPAAAIDTGAQTLELENGETVHAPALVLALGIQPDVGLARAAGLELDTGRVACDAAGRTSAEGVFAAGDVARLQNPTAGRRISVEHWGEALTQGDVAGRAAAGADAAWDAVPGFWSTIGTRTVKQASWGDGYDEIRVDDNGGGWTAWYGLDGRCVGVLTHERDEDYERGSELVAAGEPMP